MEFWDLAQWLPTRFICELGSRSRTEWRREKRKNKKAFKLFLLRFFLPSFPPVPTDLFAMLEHQNRSLDVFELHKILISLDLEALNMWKGWSGCEHACKYVCLSLCCASSNVRTYTYKQMAGNQGDVIWIFKYISIIIASVIAAATFSSGWIKYTTYKIHIKYMCMYYTHNLSCPFPE